MLALVIVVCIGPVAVLGSNARATYTNVGSKLPTVERTFVEVDSRASTPHRSELRPGIVLNLHGLRRRDPHDRG
jgi:hypothetical protein